MQHDQVEPAVDRIRHTAIGIEFRKSAPAPPPRGKSVGATAPGPGTRPDERPNRRSSSDTGEGAFQSMADRFPIGLDSRRRRGMERVDTAARGRQDEPWQIGPGWHGVNTAEGRPISHAGRPFVFRGFGMTTKPVRQGDRTGAHRRPGAGGARRLRARGGDPRQPGGGFPAGVGPPRGQQPGRRPGRAGPADGGPAVRRGHLVLHWPAHREAGVLRAGHRRAPGGAGHLRPGRHRRGGRRN